MQLPSYSFWGNWVLEMVNKLCCHFRNCILVILLNNPCKSPTVPIRQLSPSSRVLLQWRGFSFFRKYCHNFRDCTICYTSSFCFNSTFHTSTNNLTSFKVLQNYHFNEFWLISTDGICKKNNFSKLTREKLIINQKTSK